MGGGQRARALARPGWGEGGGAAAPQRRSGTPPATAEEAQRGQPTRGEGGGAVVVWDAYSAAETAAVVAVAGPDCWVDPLVRNPESGGVWE